MRILASLRRHWPKIVGYGLLVALIQINTAFAESRQQARDAVQLRQAVKLEALLTWVVLHSDSPK